MHCGTLYVFVFSGFISITSSQYTATTGDRRRRDRNRVRGDRPWMRGYRP
jgi:hypothetical protein